MSSNVSIGTDYILNLVVLIPSPLAYYGRCNVWGHTFLNRMYSFGVRNVPKKLPS